MTDDAAHTPKSTSPIKKSCPCCDVGKCVAAAMCTMSCVQFASAHGGDRRIWDIEELDLAFKALPREGGEAEPIFTSGETDSWADFT
ncbi:hypothetical protein [Hyphomicrobium sp.]|uniref:hypothetical protein n=1 Tax=Hyphomicrobium sp. TaxID=82 RepID=UPI0025C12A88|nr:hypothetical protein [Hyphomicrobium sp.]